MPASDCQVAVIGAGAAGLATARALTARGHRVVVYERADRVGGKCRSLEYRGRVYDLGANFTTPRYQRTRALAQELGLTREPIGPRRIVSLIDEPAPEVGTLRGLLLQVAAWWYQNRRARSGVDQEGFAGLDPSVRQSFRRWLGARGLGPIARVFDALFTSYGYGPVVDLPAAYALKFFDPIHLDAAIRVIRGIEVHTTTDFREGYQALWTRLVEREGLDVRLQTEILAVDRAEGGVRLRLRGPSGEEEEARADRLVLACPLDSALSFLDASDAERDLFERIQTFDYRVIAARTKGLEDLSTYLYPWSQVYTPGEVMAFYKPIPGDPEDVFLFYAYGAPDIEDSAIEARLREVVGTAPFGAEILEVLAVQRWTYFPHVGVDDMEAGFYDRLEALQGERCTWYVGELLSFPLVELVIRHAEALVARDF